jgi:hypothetical protein
MERSPEEACTDERGALEHNAHSIRCKTIGKRGEPFSPASTASADGNADAWN